VPAAAWTADVVVVGAGFAGLTAARDLSRRGYDVLVL
jgi:monoamine oxidase